MIQSATNDHVLELVVLGSDIVQKAWPTRAGVGCQPRQVGQGAVQVVALPKD